VGPHVMLQWIRSFARIRGNGASASADTARAGRKGSARVRGSRGPARPRCGIHAVEVGVSGLRVAGWPESSRKLELGIRAFRGKWCAPCGKRGPAPSTSANCAWRRVWPEIGAADRFLGGAWRRSPAVRPRGAAAAWCRLAGCGQWLDRHPRRRWRLLVGAGVAEPVALRVRHPGSRARSPWDLPESCCVGGSA